MNDLLWFAWAWWLVMMTAVLLVATIPPLIRWVKRERDWRKTVRLHDEIRNRHRR